MAAFLQCTCGRTLADGETVCGVCATQDFVEGKSENTQDFVEGKSESTASLEITLPGYEILGILGRGGMGVVYKARQLSLNRVVALKMIRDAELAGPDMLARFQKEAEAVARLQHPNIVQIHEIGAHQGRPFFALEYVPGGSLAQRLHGERQTPQAAAATVATLARAVHAVHGLGIIHRDIKPLNVLIAADGTLKITDFGLAKTFDEEHSAAAGQTRSGAILGTPSYMAPEQVQARDEKLGPAADVYALGAVLYECLTGQPPFRASTVMETLQKVLTEDPVPPSRLRANVPADLQAICQRCLEKAPSRRYGSAQALADDLQRFLDGRPTYARPIGPAARVVRWVRRRPIVAGVSAALLLLTAGTGAALVAWWTEASTSQERQQAATAEQDRITAESDQKLRQQREQRDRDKANAEARQKQEEARHKQEELEQEQDSRAGSLLRPLGRDEGPPSRTELDNLRQLAGIASERVRFQFVEQALRDAATAKRMSRRSELAIQAAVGWNLGRRQRMVDLIQDKLRDERTAPDIRVACLLLGVDLGLPTRDEAFCSTSTKIALDALARETDPYAMARMGRALAGLTPRTPSSRWTAAGAVVELMLKTNDAGALADLNVTLALLSEQMPEELAQELTGRLLEAMRTNADPDGLVGHGRGVIMLSTRMGPEQASRTSSAAFALAVSVFEQLAQDRNSDPKVLTRFVRTMVQLSARFSSETAWAQYSAIQKRGLQRRSLPPAGVAALAWVTNAVAARVEPTRRGGAELPALYSILDAMPKTTDAKAKAELARTLAELIATVPFIPADLINSCLLPIGTTSDPAALAEMVRVVDVLADLVDQTSAARGASDLLSQLLNAAFRSTNPHTAATLARSTEILAPQVSAQVAPALPTQLLQAMHLTKDPYVLAAQVRAIGAIARRADRDLLRKVPADTASKLVDAMARTSDPYFLAYLGRGIAALSAPSLGPVPEKKVFATAADKILDSMSRSRDSRALLECGRTLALLIGHVDPARRTAAVESACQQLHDAVSDTTEPRDLREFVPVLGSLTRDLPEKERLHVAAATLGRLLDTMVARPDVAGASGLPFLWEMETLAGQISTAQLVALCKSPTCVGEGQRVLLKELGRRLGIVPAVEVGCALTVATLQPCPLASAAVAKYGVTIYPGGRIPFADHWQAAEFLRLD